MRRLTLAALVAASLAWLAGQGKAQPAKLDIRGAITKATPASEEQKSKGMLGTIRVEGPKALNSNSDKALIRVTDKTKLEKRVDGQWKPAVFDDLKVGAKVEATFVGPVMESYPVQATGGTIQIVPELK